LRTGGGLLGDFMLAFSARFHVALYLALAGRCARAKHMPTYFAFCSIHLPFKHTDAVDGHHRSHTGPR
jgi:hypothetical protein